MLRYFFPKVVEKRTAAGMLNMASRIIRRLEAGERQRSEMTSRTPWWSDRIHKYRRTASRKPPPKQSPSKPAHL